MQAIFIAYSILMASAVQGGSRGGSLGSNGPPFLLIYYIGFTGSNCYSQRILHSTLACQFCLLVTVPIARIDIATGVFVMIR